jgi:hypothetical protein
MDTNLSKEDWIQDKLELFFAAFYSDLEKLKSLINTENDLTFSYNLKYENSPFFNKSFSFTVYDVLQMNLDAFFDCKDQEKTKSKSNFSPKHFYERTEECLNFLNSKFPLYIYNGVDYAKFINLISILEEDEYWFDEIDIQELQNEGYRKIDLELINYADKRDSKKVIELMNLGANPMIDPDDKTDESEVLSTLGSSDGFHFTQLIAYHKSNCDKSKLDFSDFEYLFKQLYASASASMIYKIIDDMYTKKENPIK